MGRKNGFKHTQKLKLLVKVFFQSCKNINLCENKTHPAFTCRKALSSFLFFSFKSVHTMKVATKIFNIANLRDMLCFKLAANNRTHQRAWKTDKKEFNFASGGKGDECR